MLCNVAELLTSSLRSEDIVARYGGDEFVLLLPGLDASAAEQVASRIVDAARGRSVTGAGGDTVNITLSLGTATQDSGDKFEKPANLLAAAEKALGHSKRNGREQHTCYDAIKAA